jgi:hypothetical protein
MKGDESSTMGSMSSITSGKLGRSGASRNLSGESCSPLVVFAGKPSSGGSTDMSSSGNGGNVLDRVQKEIMSLTKMKRKSIM